jgi:hypothetical protein
VFRSANPADVWEIYGFLDYSQIALIGPVGQTRFFYAII